MATQVNYSNPPSTDSRNRTRTLKTHLFYPPLRSLSDSALVGTMMLNCCYTTVLLQPAGWARFDRGGHHSRHRRLHAAVRLGPRQRAARSFRHAWLHCVLHLGHLQRAALSPIPPLSVCLQHVLVHKGPAHLPACLPAQPLDEFRSERKGLQLF